MATILIVEDEALAALELKEFLESKGFSVPAVIESGDSALEAVMKYCPDLIIMDIRLKSFIDGVDAANRIRFLSKVPIIFTSAFSGPEMQCRLKSAQPYTYIVKPIDNSFLLNEVKRMLQTEEVTNACL